MRRRAAFPRGIVRIRLILAIAAAFALNGGSGRPIVHALNNPVAVENALPGTIDHWDIVGTGDQTIQGFATDISVNSGQTVTFKINTDSSNYKIDIYRLGYYGGAGARKVTTVAPSATLPQTQPACITDSSTGLVDCGNWAVSASWTTTNAVSGVYLAKLTRIDSGGASHIVFIVREDARKADLLMQTSDTTWQAYNAYGGASTYCAPAGVGVSNAGSAYAGACPNRATKASYNRPVDTRGNGNARSFFFSAEYPMVRWLEANGYDVKYWAGVDTDRRGADLVDNTIKPSAFLSVGHDEYWSGDQRTRIEAAREAGVSLAFFSGNELYWKTRYEPSVDGSTTEYRTLVSYKETLAGAKLDPAVDGTGHPIWTGSWRDPRFSPPADGSRPENAVTGTAWTVNTGTSAITIPASMANLRIWQNTRVAALTSGEATLSAESLGYEWDEDLDNGARPAGIVHLSSTTMSGVEKIIDYGATTGIGTATHHLTLYRHGSGALVFGAGTVQWTWGLDAIHDGGAAAAHLPDQAMQQATITLLSDMGARPATLRIGANPALPLIATEPSADTIAPTSVITSPTGGELESGNPITIQGTAADTGGVPAGVEVSVDDGATWQSAQGTVNWSFTWSPAPSALGTSTATILSRAIDDSGNMEIPGSGVHLTIVPGNCPCTSIWKPTTIPGVPSVVDGNAVELGVKFKSDVDGFIVGIRFYKGTTNVGTHIGSLWTIGGTLLASATFTGETPSGWQQVNFTLPVNITKDTVYVASYHTNVGHYAGDGAYFADTATDSPPLRALLANTSGGNGVYRYGPSAFPSNTFNATNYYVDVAFAETVIDSTPLVISDVNTTAIDGSRAIVTWKTSKPATSAIDYPQDPALPWESFTTVSEDALVTRHRIALTGLVPNATYDFIVSSMDAEGNFAMSMAPSYTTPAPALRDTAVADFSAGTLGVGAYVSESGNGEVILTPTIGTEFSGDALSSGWIDAAFDSPGHAAVDRGLLLADGVRVATCVTDGTGECIPETQSSTPSAIYTAPHALEFAANFSGDQYQHAGFAQTLWTPSEPWAIFTTTNTGVLHARTNVWGTVVDTELPLSLLGSLHRFRIDWRETAVNYYVDDALVASHAVSLVGPLRPIAASDFNLYGGRVIVDWMRMSPYAARGMFQSRVFDALSSLAWNSIFWTGTTPAGTTIAMSVRTGDTPGPDPSWSAFVPVSAPGALQAQGRYVQYQAELATTDPSRTPALADVIVASGLRPAAVSDRATIHLDTTHTFPASGPGSLTENDIDPDTPKDRLRVMSVTMPANGTATVDQSGAVTYQPTPGFVGVDSFTYTVSDGLLTATGLVSMEVGRETVVNSNPVANNDIAIVAVNGGANAIDVLANDTSGPDTGETLSISAVTQAAHGTVTFSAGAVSYTPAADYTGSDSFTYTIDDGNGGTSTATVSITS